MTRAIIYSILDNLIMNTIIRKGRSTKIIKNATFLSISSDVGGICLEVDNPLTLFTELEKDGFNPVLKGKLLVVEADGVSVFDTPNNNKDGKKDEQSN